MQRLADGVVWAGRRRRREGKVEGEEKYQREWKRMMWVYGRLEDGMVERWCSGESWIQLMRHPRWEADRCAWDWPIVVGEPEGKSQMS